MIDFIRRLDPVTVAKLLSALRALMVAIGMLAAATGHHLPEEGLAVFDQVAGIALMVAALLWGQYNAHSIEAKAKEREDAARNEAALAVLKAPVPSDKSSTVP